MVDQQVVSRQLRFEAGESDGRTLVGLAVPFNEQTRIDNFFEGTFDEQFRRGAFKRTLSMKTPKLQFDHGTHPMLGSIPIGHFERLKEIDRGLDVRAPIFDNWMTEPVRDAIRTEAIDGMSIRFRPIKVETTEPEARTDGGEVELRTITEAELIELGPVVFPAYEGTSVDVRSLELAALDLSSEIDRHRLAAALLGGVSNDRGGPGHSEGQGTDPEAGSPAEVFDPAASHSDSKPPPNRRRAFVARLHEHMESNSGYRTASGAAARSR